MIQEKVAGASFTVVGSGLNHTVNELAGLDDRISVTGFVEDLSPYYARCSVAVIPLRRGAGVKFKAIEALVAGTPAVTTTLGAEGIGGSELFAGVHDTAYDFASAVIDVLLRPSKAEEHARVAQAEAQALYSRDHFIEIVRRIYAGP